jgi:hypothetical protein
MTTKQAEEGMDMSDDVGTAPTALSIEPLEAELLAVVKAFVAETVEYMTINHLGDPEGQHNVRWARKVIAKAEGQQ